MKLEKKIYNYSKGKWKKYEENIFVYTYKISSAQTFLFAFIIINKQLNTAKKLFFLSLKQRLNTEFLIIFVIEYFYLQSS